MFMKTKLITALAFCAISAVAQNNMEVKEVTATTPAENPQATQEEEVYTIVEYMPSFPGGQAELTKFVQKNIVYPKTAQEKGIGGKCYLKFIIKPDGTISDIKVLKGVPNCPECDEEAFRVVKLMPKWIPGRQDGKAVPTYWNLPVNFEMKNK